MTLKAPASLDLLRNALEETRTTIRSYDTKAQIVGIGYIFALNIIGGFEKRFDKVESVDFLFVLVSWGVVIVPIVMFGSVLYPSRKMAPDLENEVKSTAEGLLYIDPGKGRSVDDLLDASERCDPRGEVAFELLKVSHLRDLKRKRFLRALFAAGFCFMFIFTSQLIRSL